MLAPIAAPGTAHVPHPPVALRPHHAIGCGQCVGAPTRRPLTNRKHLPGTCGNVSEYWSVAPKLAIGWVNLPTNTSPYRGSMNVDRRLFELPLYRLSFDQWSADVDTLMEPHRRAMDGQGRTEAEVNILAARSIRLEPWLYNEVVAWIAVEWMHDKIKSYVWRRNGKRFQRNPTGPFRFWDKLTETDIYPDQADEVIASEVRKDLVSAVDEFRGRRAWCLDLTAYDAVAPFLNWKQVIGTRTV